MRKSLLLFFLLIVSIVVWKVSEHNVTSTSNETTSEELAVEFGNDKIAKN